MLWKLPALALLCAAAFVSLGLGNPLVDLLDRLRGSSHLGPAWRSRVFLSWASAVGRVIGMRAEVVGEPPKGPFLLVSNHLGYVDIVLLGAQLRCVFVAKSEVRGWPVMGWLCAAVDTLFIDRRNKRDIPRVTRAFEGILDGGRGVVVFPEGTSSGGAEVLPFRPSLLEAAARARMPVYYASVAYSTAQGCEPASRSVCWWGEMEFVSHLVRLLKLPGFTARLVFGPTPIRADDRKQLAARLQREVARQHAAAV